MELSIIERLNDHAIDQLVELYGNEFWCNKRQHNDVARMLENTDIVIGVINETDDLVGFTRVLTDYVYKATLYDVIVHPKWRGNKIGRLLMDTILNHDKLRDVEHFDLNCLPKMYPFYKQWGFTTDVGELGFMRKFNRQLA